MSDEPRLAIEDMTVIERLDRLQSIVRDMQDGYNPEPQDVEELVEGLANIKREIEECIDDDVHDCCHCGSPFTFLRSDGDIGCYDCPGIMPRCSECGHPTTYCEECEQDHHRDSFQQEHADAREEAE